MGWSQQAADLNEDALTVNRENCHQNAYADFPAGKPAGWQMQQRQDKVWKLRSPDDLEKRGPVGVEPQAAD